MLAHAKSSTTSVLDKAADLANGRTSSCDLIEAALAQIADPAGEGARTFVKIYGDTARAAAYAQDRLRKAGYIASPLAGLPISIKDLFDVSGECTLAGSKALDDSPPAASDAPVVSRLRAAGAVLIGRTNMTEFAFSGVGERWRRRYRDRDRYRRVGPHPSGTLRHRGVQADAETHPSRRRHTTLDYARFDRALG